MSRLDDLNQVVIQQNGKKLLLQKISITTTAARTNLASQATVTYNAPPIPFVAGAQLMLQSDQDFYYNLCPAGATTTVTNAAGASPGTFVSAGQQEFVFSSGGSSTPQQFTDGAIDVLASTTSGNLSIFLVT